MASLRHHRTLSCSTGHDICHARTYGCVNGIFFMRAPTSVPAICAGAEAGLTGGDDSGSPFGSDDATSERILGRDGRRSAGRDGNATNDASSDAPADRSLTCPGDSAPDACATP